MKGQLAAMFYLAKVNKNYRMKHYGDKVILEHWGDYGYDMSGGIYYTWQQVHKVEFYDK